MQLYRKLTYIKDFCATDLELIYGSDVSTVNPYEEMELAKISFDQTERNAFYHYVLSIEKNEESSILHFKDVAIEVCELISSFYGKYQVLMAIHINTKNLHAHYVANTIDYLTGNRFDLNWRRLEELKKEISKILVMYDLLPVRMKNGQFD